MKMPKIIGFVSQYKKGSHNYIGTGLFKNTGGGEEICVEYSRM